MTKREPKRELRPDAVSQYVQARIERLYDNGRGPELVAISLAVGVAKSHASQVLSGELGVAERTIPLYAAYFGFENADALREAAYEWWLSRRRQKVRGLTIAMRGAREELLRSKRATPLEIDSILDAYSHDRFRSRDVEWWIETIMRELREERARRRDAPDDSADDSGPRRAVTVSSR